MTLGSASATVARTTGIAARDEAASRYRDERSAFWDGVARKWPRWRGLGGAYHRRLAEIYRARVSPGLRVLEIGCGEADLLAALAPARGVGVDFSEQMLALARARHPQLELVSGDAHELAGIEGPFDVVVLSDLLNDVWDAQRVLEQIRPLVHERTRLILNFYSRVWGPLLGLAQRLRLARPTLAQNWLTVDDVRNLLRLAGFRHVSHSEEILLPLPLPLLTGMANRYLVKLWPFYHLALTHVLVARPEPEAAPVDRTPPSVSVVVPARNEAGNIEAIFARTPEMGAGTELIFVEGHSQDDTFAAIERAIAAHPERLAKLFRQPGKGKGDAVRHGFAAASGDVLMILDADLTVPPEDLPRFLAALADGHGEFVNGVRLVYPMERQAMRFANLVANKLFGIAFSYLLGQPVRDTLCGTKVLWREEYAAIAASRAVFGDFDPFGDFDLLFGAARLNLEIVELPIRYRERTYGTTNIQRWRHGVLLLRMCFYAASRIKFR